MTEIPYKGSPVAPPDLIANRPIFMIDPLAAATPRPVVIKLNEEVQKALDGADLKKRFEDMGLVAKPGTPEEFGRFLQAEITRWKGLVKKAP